MSVDAVGVVGQVLQRHRAVLDDRDGLGVAAHRGHDVEARGAHFPDRRLAGAVGHFHHALGITELGHRLGERVEPRGQRLGLVAGELHQQQRARLAAHVFRHRGREGRDAARELDHRAVDQLHRDRVERDQRLGRAHRRAEAREVADAERLGTWERLQREVDRGEVRQRALGAHQQPGHVVPLGPHALDRVAADVALHPRDAGRDLARLARRDRAHALDQLAVARRFGGDAPRRRAGRSRRSTRACRRPARRRCRARCRP